MVRSLRLPQLNLTHQLMAIGYGAILMIWLSTENAHVGLTVALGFGLALLIIGLGVLHWLGGRKINLVRGWLILLGMLAGVLSALTTFFLMLFKNVQHSHVVPDFSNEVMWGVLVRTPAWALAGGLIGGALMLLVMALLGLEELSDATD